MRRALVVAVVLGLPGWAGAAPARVTWTTYFYGVPGQPSTMLDQIDRGTKVEKIGCSAGWCRVRVTGVEGYVDEAVLGDLPDKSAASAATGGCFTIGLVSFNTLRPAEICPARGAVTQAAEPPPR